jgi:GNAT superfamily N-acetyltransferase
MVVRGTSKAKKLTTRELLSNAGAWRTYEQGVILSPFLFSQLISGYPAEWRGLVVHPAYQRRGLGGQLAAHRNDIAKRAGFAVYGVARTTSRSLFIQHGAVVLGTCSVDIQKYNGSCPAHGQVYVMRQGQNIENYQETVIAKDDN